MLLLGVSVFRNILQIGEINYMERSLLVIVGKIHLFVAVLLIRRYMGKDYYAELTNFFWLFSAISVYFL